MKTIVRNFVFAAAMAPPLFWVNSPANDAGRHAAHRFDPRPATPAFVFAPAVTPSPALAPIFSGAAYSLDGKLDLKPRPGLPPPPVPLMDVPDSEAEINDATAEAAMKVDFATPQALLVDSPPNLPTFSPHKPEPEFQFLIPSPQMVTIVFVERPRSTPPPVPPPESESSDDSTVIPQDPSAEPTPDTGASNPSPPPPPPPPPLPAIVIAPPIPKAPSLPHVPDGGNVATLITGVLITLGAWRIRYNR